jgi:O-antigen ligase
LSAAAANRIRPRRIPRRDLRAGSPASEVASGEQTATRRLPLPVIFFLVSLVIPWIIPIGPANFTPSRILLIIFLLPSLLKWLRGDAGPIRLVDIGIVMYAAWAGLCLFVAHGISQAAEPAAIFFIETVGAYLLARCYIRDEHDFRNVFVLMATLLAIIFPFAVYEWITGQKPILNAFSAIFPTVEITTMTPRMGFWRVQGPFSHSIEFGVFCGSLFTFSVLVLGHRLPLLKRLLIAGLVGFSAALSMSSAPTGGIVLQLFLLSWYGVLRNVASRWKLLLALMFLGYLAIEFGSNQTPVQFYISKFTFEQQTGWYRIWIWDYGSESVVNHPWFGIGLNDWVRPAWMPANSVDNFWLLTAMRYGLPAFLFLVGSILLMMFGMSKRIVADKRLQPYGTAFLICMSTYAFVGSTVHFWGAPYMWYVFVLGTGGWMLGSGEVRPDTIERNLAGPRARRATTLPARTFAPLQRRART